MLDITVDNNVISGVAPEVKEDTIYEIPVTAELADLDKNTLEELNKEKQKILFKARLGNTTLLQDEQPLIFRNDQ